MIQTFLFNLCFLNYLTELFVSSVFCLYIARKLKDMKEKLCYVEGNIAYFTTQDLDKQWGDDWDDAPYEHNAGLPYLPSVYYYADGRSEKNIRDWNKDGTPKWEIIKVMFEADLYTPCHNAINSPYSVQDINNGKVAWLESFDKEFYIYAGVSIKEFKRLVELSGGNIYLKA